MGTDPFQQFLIIDTSICHAEPDPYDVFIRAVNRKAVHSEERQHNMHPDPLISIDKSMIGNEGIAQPGTLFLFGRIEFFSSKAGINIFQSRFQKCFITHTHTASRFLGDELMQ